MKVARTYTLDVELVTKLMDEENASALINKLLIEHYKDFRSEDEIIKDVKKKIAEKQDKIDSKIRIDEAVKKRTTEMITNRKQLK